ncbi:hypothetical protein DM01DRAFT_1191704 [Hesseltinella vesiculosa]|uniref:Chromatin modification-related protein n=1 Tax=Hesseltinella vesiculosa TaxID=101127 RepID=A0A1X2GRP5_9FUNG|nr:hypothetical protein DM01DRAFT_1191704 [Hesseltinella vesiculosa]
MEFTDIQQDTGRYLQEYIQSLENLPSEIGYHWAEIQNREDQGKHLERRVHTGQHDLTKIHRSWFSQDQEKREKYIKHEPNLIKRIQRDYDKLEDLATERIKLAENALHLVDRHLKRLGTELDIFDRAHPELRPTQDEAPPLPTNTMDDLTNEEDEDEAYFNMMAQRQKKRKKKEVQESEEGGEEPLYCYCRQVSYGEMVGCDGENCPYEWFHMDCTGLTAPPKGAWYCDECSFRKRKKKKL